MENSVPLISICIPTYNRATYLRQALNSYVNNSAFTSEVEIVVSDNASTDDTESVCKEFTEAYPNIKYFRNEQNVVVENFLLVLDRAKGKFLKLMNDNLLIDENGLSYLKEKVKEHEIDKDPLFFTNGIIFNKDKRDCFECKSFDEFIFNLSYVVTAIMIFGCWREDWANVKDRLKYADTLICQDDWVYQIIESRGKALIFTGNYCHHLVLENKHRKGYNWFEVHVENYFKILQPYIDKGLVSPKTLSKDRRSYLKNLPPQMVMAYMYNIIPEWQFDMSGATKVLWKYFWKEPLFYLMFFTLPLWGTYKIIRFLMEKK